MYLAGGSFLNESFGRHFSDCMVWEAVSQCIFQEAFGKVTNWHDIAREKFHGDFPYTLLYFVV